MPTATQQEFSWKVGDKAFHDHEEVTITDIEDGRVTGLTNGYIRSGYWNFNPELFPVTDGGRKIVDFFHEQYEDLHKMPGNRLFNWPDLARAIELKFVETMRSYHAGSTPEVLKAGLFFRTVKDFAATVIAVNVDGVFLFNSNR